MGSLDLGILFIIGIGVFGGIIGAVIFQRLKIPQVIGYIAIGILIGKTGFKIIDQEVIDTFRVFNFFALGIIGFLVGGELLGSTLKKYGKQFSGILLGEGLLSFLFVTLLSGGVVYFITRDIIASLALGVVFGAVASATDPASTMDVLWEYRAAGILTTTIIAIVALDDALAMTLYGIGSGVAQILLGGGAELGPQVVRIGIEIFGAIALGAAGGFLMNVILRYTRKKERILAFAIGLLILVISTAQILRMDIIFAAMTMGIVVRNLAPERSRQVFELIRSFSVPIYVLFFVFVGARLEVTNMPWWMWMLVGLYCVGRNGGKILGAFIGGKITGAERNVRRYTGMGLSAQGGVTIGLAIMASGHLDGVPILGMSLGEIIIFTITATTFIFQVTGPPMVKLAVKLSGEIGRNVTEEDVVAKWKVADVLAGPPVVILRGDTMRQILTLFSEYSYLIYPVVDGEGRFAGIISFDDIKNIMTNEEVWEWIVADDILRPDPHTLKADEPLAEALDLMNQIRREQLPVIDSEGRPAGILDSRETRTSVEREIIAIKGGRAA
jgi:Kef-type K+ transport system membrane component KefB